MTDGVVIGWLFPDKVSGWFCYSVADLMHWDAQKEGRLLSHNGGGFMCLSSGPRVAEARNTMIDEFAKTYPEADWLFMVDSDMTFEPTIIEDLLASADPVERPIMGALAFAASGDNGGPFPTIYREVEVEDGGVLIDRVLDYPQDTIIKVGATGGAGLLIHRNVFAAMKEPYPKGFGTLQNGAPNPYPWFAEGLTDSYGKPLGEDVAFCRKARHMGIPVHVDTSVKMGHIKSYRLDEEYFLEHKDDVPGRQYDRSNVGVAEAHTKWDDMKKNRAQRRAEARKR